MHVRMKIRRRFDRVRNACRYNTHITSFTFRRSEQYNIHRLEHDLLLVNRIFDAENVGNVLSITGG